MPAVERAVQVLRALSGETAGLRLAELSPELGMSMSTLSELLATLEAARMVERDPVSRAFRLGPELVELGLAARSGLDLTRAARRELEWLREASGETAILHVPSGSGAVIVDAAESGHQLKVAAPLGHRLPALAGSVGKVLLAAAAEDQQRAALAMGVLPAFTELSITEPDAYLAELIRVRRHGYATDDEEYLAGVRAASAAVTSGDGATEAVISVAGASSRLAASELRSLAEEVRGAAARVSERLGGPPAAGGTDRRARR